MTRKSNSKRKNVVSNVRVVSDAEGTDGIRVERMIDYERRSLSQFRLIAGIQQSIAITTTTTLGQVAYAAITGCDDFLSMGAQFNTFRIRAMKFDIYDLNPGVSITNFFSTYHQGTGSAAPQSLENVVDRPDSKSIAPGTGRQTFYWVAHGTQELAFQETAGTIVDFGGLSYSVGSLSTPVSGKYQIIVKALVDFRGRS
jgi:hypothetical protein